VATGQGASTVGDYAGHIAALAACFQVDHITIISEIICCATGSNVLVHNRSASSVRSAKS
jgi:hypothetical protein